MRQARHLLRRLAAILRVAALLVMVPAFAQAHAGHARVGHASKAAPGVAAVIAAPEAAADRADCLACPGCCCAHVFVAASDGDGVRADRPSGDRVAMGPDSVRPSAVSEALPEPPRPIA